VLEGRAAGIDGDVVERLQIAGEVGVEPPDERRGVRHDARHCTEAARQSALGARPAIGEHHRTEASVA